MDGKQITVASNALDNLEAAALRSGRGTKAVADGMSDLGGSSARASKDLTNTSEAVGRLSDASTSASKNVAGAANDLGDLAGGGTVASGSIKSATSSLVDLGSISSTASSNLQNTNLVIGEIAGGSTAASGSIQNASDSLNNMGGSADNAADANRRAAQETENVGDASSRASISIKDIAVSLGLVALASAAFNTLKSSLDGAISRFDTLTGFPVIMERMGFSSEQAESSVKKLADGIQGLPTTLNGIVKNAQGIAILTGDLDNATDTALALNNAFLASGSSSMDAERGLTQYVQMLSKGSVDMQSWRTLQETMGFALNKTAESFGFAGRSAQNDFYEALKSGAVSFDDFNEKLIELNGGVGGFAEIAKTGSAGIATSMGNLKNAVIVGVANIVTSFDNLSQATTGKTIAQNLDGLKVVVGSSFKVIRSVIEGSAPVVKVFANTVSSAIPVVKALTPAILGLTAAYATYTVVSKAATAINVAKEAIIAAQTATKTLTLVTAAQITAQMTASGATQADIAAKLAQTATINLNTFALGVLTGKITLSTAKQIIATAATYAWGAAVKFLMGPVGWITAGIGLLVAGVIAVVKWFKKSTEESKKLNAETEKLANSTNSLNESVGSSAEAYKNQQSDIAASAKAAQEMADRLDMLAGKENKSSAEKSLMQSRVEALNGAVEGLNLTYDEETNKMNLSAEQIANRIKLMKDKGSLLAGEERFLEIAKEQAEVDAKLKENNALRAQWNQDMKDRVVSAGDYKKAIAELDEQEKALGVTVDDLKERRKAADAEVEASMAQVTEAIENGVEGQTASYEKMKEHQQDIVDELKSSWEGYKNQATDMFDTIETKSSMTAKKMTENLLANQKAINEWSVNIAALAERGIDDGLLNTLREAGPEAAGLVNNLVKSSDEELKKLSDTFGKGGEVATNALNASLGKENSGVMESVGHLVTQAGTTFNEQVKRADFQSLGKAMPEGAAAGVAEGTKDVTEATKKMADESEKAFKGVLDINSPSGVFEKFGVNITEGADKGIRNGTPAVVLTMQNLAKAMTDQFNDIRAEFVKIGSDTTAGLDQGLKGGQAKVMATARALANEVAVTMRKALDTHSPSRVTTKIGKDTGAGFVKGLQSAEKAAAKAAKKTAKSAVSGMKKETQSAEKAAKAAAKATADSIKKEADAVKARLDSVKTYVADKKSLDQLTVVGEAQVWQRAITQFKVGSKERIEAQKSYKTAVEAVNKEVESINKEHLDKVNKINDELAKSEQKLNDEYNNAFSSRVSSILNFAGIFDEFSNKFVGDGQTLISNLESQVHALEVWKSVMTSLSGRIDDQALLEELEGLGPGAVGELQALNNLSDEELSKYVSLYNTKFSLAREKATDELSGMKEDTVTRIEELRAAANVELGVLEKEWVLKIGTITKATDDKLKGLKDVGIDAGKGLLDGLSSMESALVDKASSIAEAVKKAMASALDIRSPSRWMRDMIGKNMMLGWMQGMDGEKSAVIAKSREATDWMKPDMPALKNLMGNLGSVLIPDINLTPFNASVSAPRLANSAGGESGGNFDAVLEAIDKLVSRPNVIEIDGRQVVQATAVEMNGAIKSINQQNNKYRRG